MRHPHDPVKAFSQGFRGSAEPSLGAPAHPFALMALHESPLQCIRNKPVESLAATGRGFLGFAKKRIKSTPSVQIGQSRCSNQNRHLADRPLEFNRNIVF